MATYNGIHVETEDRDAIRRLLDTWRGEWWKFWLSRRYGICHSVDGWTETAMGRSCVCAGRLCEYLSRQLRCRALALGYQTTAGLQYIRVCDEGTTLRVLWFAPGLDSPYVECGMPLEFEAAFVAQQRVEAEQEYAALDENLRADSGWMLRHTSHLPGCRDFAEALGCRSYNR